MLSVPVPVALLTIAALAALASFAVVASREARRLKAQLAQARRMAAVGEMASGIADDFNNTLTAARGYAELIRAETHGTLRGDVTALIEVVDRGKLLTRQLLDVAHAGRATGALDAEG
jgi:C4-dicarboxylate-specific signal transduction histidine kinase